MQSTVAGLYHDAAALRRFVEDSKRFCEEAEHESYVGASEKFFRYVSDLAAATIKFLDRIPQQGKSDDRIRAERQKLVLVKGYWGVVHSYIKPATDANTLRVPVALVDFLSNLPEGTGFSPAKIVILLSQELNYFQYPHTGLKKADLQLRGIFEEVPAFPEGLGFIGIPYSQGSNFFTNLVIFHELGHFFFEEKARADALKGSIEDALIQWKAFAATDPETQAWARGLLHGWAQEIYCDLFAIKLIGPSYSLAYLELGNLIGLFKPEQVKRFSESHPSDACRFREHVKLLEEKKNNWWAVVEGLESEQVELIKHLATLDEQEYKFVLNDRQEASRGFIDAFLRVLPQVQQEIAKTLTNTKPPVDVFNQYKTEIQACLSQGIVPSAVFEVEERNPSGPSESIALINSAFFFYLTSLDTLINNIAEQDPTNIEHRSVWTKKLEAWTLKALENIRLLGNQGNIK